MPPVKLPTISSVSQNAARLLPWSYSKLSAYEKCPRVAFLRYVVPRGTYVEPPNPHMERGNREHTVMEGWARGGFKALAPRYKRFAEEAKRTGLAKQKKLVIEELMSFDAELKPVEKGHPSEWFRVKWDLAAPAIGLLVDHKTGKIYPEHRDQGELYGATYFSHYPGDSVETEFWYLDQAHIRGMTVRRDDVPRILAAATKRVAVMVEDTTFKPKPSGLCAYCGFSKTKGGPCKEG